MEERSRGTILRTRPLTETSLIVLWLTPEHGRISTVAKGARRPKSPYLGKLDLYYEAEFTFQRSRRSQLHTLREVSLLQSRPQFRSGFALLEAAATASRWIEKNTEEETPLPEIFALHTTFLNELKEPLNPAIPLAFEIKLLSILGLEPDVESSPLTPGSRSIAAQLLRLDFPALNRLKLSFAQATELAGFLQRSLQHQV